MKTFYLAKFLLLSVAMGLWGAETGLHIHPLETSLIPGKPNSFLVSNQSDELVCVRVQVEEWEISRDGSQRFFPSEDVRMEPSQFFLKAKMHASVQITWRGENAKLQSERPYRVSFLQSGIGKPSASYQPSRAALYVRSFRPRPSLALLKAKFHGDLLELRLENRGNSHISLENPTVLLRLADGQQIELSEDRFLNSHAPPILHAKRQRQLLLKLPEGFDPREVSSATLGFCGQEQAVCTLIEVDIDRPKP